MTTASTFEIFEIIEIFETIPINTQTLTTMSKMFDFINHGDIKMNDRIEWDLEFPDMFKAVSFAQIMKEFDYYIDIRTCDPVDSLYKSVSLTLFVELVED